MSAELKKKPITVITGFLGSGKTTVLNHLLRDEKFSDTAVIINEFGEIGIDHLLVDTSFEEEEMVVMQSGCICCTISGRPYGHFSRPRNPRKGGRVTTL